MITITNEDNMQLMARYPDKYFDLAIVDPEYGINADKPSRKPNKAKQKNGSILNVKSPIYKHKNWDSKPAGKEYFDELLRVSKHQIIFGVNHYNYVFGIGRIVWDKLNGDTDQYDCEIMYNSINNRTDLFHFLWSGMFQGTYCGKDTRKALIQQGNKSLNEKRIHPTQKPTAVYKYLLNTYARKGDVILDTNTGSNSLAIACYDYGFDLVGCELDEEIYNSGMKRLKQHQSQTKLF